MPGKTTTTSALSPARALAATVTVIDQHGKVVQNGSKSFFAAIREAKEAYKNRKLEIAAERQAERRARETVMRRGSHTRRGSDGAPMMIQGAAPPTPTLHSTRETAVVPSKRKHRKHKRSSDEDVIVEDSLVVHEDHLQRRGSDETIHFDDGTTYSPRDDKLATKNATLDVVMTNQVLDMAPALFNDPAVVAVQALLARVQSIIDEIQCWAVGLSTLISELQKTPETFAAVGLSLAEIAQLITHITPAATIVLKAGFPTIFALISSPHFSIVAGVGAAATVVVLGGYKIVKNIMSGADDNLKMAYGDLPDEDILDEAALGGEILGEVIEDRLLMAARAEPVEDIVVVKPKHEKKVLMAPEDEVVRQARQGWYGDNNNKEHKKAEKEKVSREERKHDREDKREREERRERRREKEERAARRREGVEGEEKHKGKLERRGTLPRQASNSSGLSSNRSDSSEERSVHRKSPRIGSEERSAHRKSPRIGSEKEKEKPTAPDQEKEKKKKSIIKKLFDGRSA